MKILLGELKQLIRNVIVEKRKLHTDDRIADSVNTLQQYVDKGLFFHMTNDYRLHGVNVKSGFNTPIGIYVYPLTQDFFKQLITGKLPFAVHRNDIIIYKSRKAPLKVSEYTWDDFYQDAQKLGFDFKDMKNEIDQGLLNKDDEYNKRKFDKENILPINALFWCVYNGHFGTDPGYDGTGGIKGEYVKGNKNLQKLGYSGVYDDIGAGAIHPNEPIQAFFVSSKFLDIVDVVKNPIAITHKSINNLLSNKYNINSPWELKHKDILTHFSEKQIVDKIKVRPEFMLAIKNPTDAMIMAYIHSTIAPHSAINDIKEKFYTKPTQDMIDYAEFLTTKKYSNPKLQPNDNIKRIMRKYNL